MGVGSHFPFFWPVIVSGSMDRWHESEREPTGDLHTHACFRVLLATHIVEKKEKKKREDDRGFDAI
jgi:hypothetical protein